MRVYGMPSLGRAHVGAHVSDGPICRSWARMPGLMLEMRSAIAAEWFFFRLWQICDSWKV